ncbi:hypothetical protein ABI_43400 [Asticcacaulis biprosthecium C19]|uniref:Uncharacterized protein n=1 Tax=Asticcacaulis biprosthecium C19 TaxID=715226 RepID=F4QT46_9CAUL|nr:hypothetical protein ABI_43400 [Asticcacaulis biprosthecium C19]
MTSNAKANQGIVTPRFKQSVDDLIQVWRFLAKPEFKSE